MRAVVQTSGSIVFLLLLAGLAGCIGESPPTSGDEAPPFVDPMAHEDGHDHGDYETHGRSWNLEEIGWDRISSQSVAWGELDIHPDHDIALVAHAWPTAGFATVDISDPADPQVLDVYDLGHGYGADVKWDPSGEWAVLAVQAHSQLELPDAPVPLIDPLAATVHSGIEVFHITEEGVIHDIDAWTPSPERGVHMVATHRIDGRDYVFTAYNGKGVGVFELITEEPPIGARLVPVNAALMGSPERLVDQPTTLGLSGAHDMTVIDDPLLETPLLYVAHGYDGLYVYDLSDPHDPLWPDFPLGHWIDEANTWYMHTVQAEVVDDQRRIVLVPEVFSDAEAEVVAPLWVLDGTDLSDIGLLATWRNPGDHGSELLRFSVHNFQLIDSKIALAHYHGGVWLLEIQDQADGTRIEPVGYHVPGNDPGVPKSGIYHGVYNMMDAPTVWDVVVHDGVLYATDVNSGIYAIDGPAWEAGDGTMSIG